MGEDEYEFEGSSIFGAACFLALLIMAQGVYLVCAGLEKVWRKYAQ